MRRVLIIAVILLLAGFIAYSGVSYYLTQKDRSTLKNVSIHKMPDGSFKMFVADKPYFVKGVVYSPIPIGQDQDYNFWGDPAKPWLVDGKLMKAVGINTVRFYHPGKNPDEVKEVIRDLYKRFGIMTVLGHYLDFWEYPPSNYSDSYTRERIKKKIVEMVNTYKDEPGLLFWTLGNENNYSFDRDVNVWSNESLDNIQDPNELRLAKAKIYYSFIEDLAKTIHELDPNHPVAMGNGELGSLEVADKICNDVDIFGGILYRGKNFGGFFKELKRKFNRPNCFLEFGCDSFDAYKNTEDQDEQMRYLVSQWQEIVKNSSTKNGGIGNSLGGFVFEWTDEWWKSSDGQARKHSVTAGWPNPAYYDSVAVYNMNEEWWGLVGVSSEIKNGTNKRIPKKAYYALKNLWRN